MTVDAVHAAERGCRGCRCRITTSSSTTRSRRTGCRAPPASPARCVQRRRRPVASTSSGCGRRRSASAGDPRAGFTQSDRKLKVKPVAAAPGRRGVRRRDRLRRRTPAAPHALGHPRLGGARGRPDRRLAAHGRPDLVPLQRRAVRQGDLPAVVHDRPRLRRRPQRSPGRGRPPCGAGARGCSSSVTPTPTYLVTVQIGHYVTETLDLDGVRGRAALPAAPRRRGCTPTSPTSVA